MSIHQVADLDIFQRMHSVLRAFDDPVYLIVYMLEKARAISLLKTLEDLSDVVLSDHWFPLCIRHQPVRRTFRIIARQSPAQGSLSKKR